MPDLLHTLRLDPKTNDRETPLHLACKKGEVEIAKFLVQSGANITITPKRGGTALLLACESGQEALVMWLAQRPECNCGAVDDEGNTALHLTAATGMSRAVETLLGCKGVNRAQRNYRGQTPLQIATTNSSSSRNRSRSGDLSKVTALGPGKLIRGISVGNTTKSKNGAAGSGAKGKGGAGKLNQDVVRLLSSSSTPAERKRESAEIVTAARIGALLHLQRYIHEGRGVCRARDEQGNTALMAAAGAGESETLQWLLEQMQTEKVSHTRKSCKRNVHSHSPTWIS